MKVTVIHHSADFDGIFCREIARKFLPDAELIGWDFKDKPIKAPSLMEGKIYVLDLPVDRVFGFDYKLSPAQPFVDPDVFVWIDHHKSSIDSHPTNIPGYRIDGVAACRLAWQWFMHCALPDHDGHDLPAKQDYTDRKVFEPLAVRLAGEYDIWDKRDPAAELFQHGLRSCDLTPRWERLLGSDKLEAKICVNTLLKNGEALQYAKTEENASVIKDIGFTFQWEGLTFLACNAARYNSHLFTASLRPEHDACFGFKWAGNDWSVSLYHAPGKEHHDLSTIAVKYGGGGHRGACGFQTDTLPFLK